MKQRPAITVALILGWFMLPLVLSAQQVQWLTATPASWVLNPATPVDVLCAEDPDHVYVARLDAVLYTANQPMGAVTLSRQVADGTTLWSVTLGDSVQVESIASDANGNLVLGGRYYHRLKVDGSPVLTVPVGHVSAGSFLCAWDAGGQLLWQQDVSGGSFESVSVASVALDEQGRFWAALSQFSGADIVRLDANGAQVETRPLVDSKTIGSISFDPWGGLYVSGAGQSPEITINGTPFAIPHNYAFFVTRMNANGAAQWVRSASDISFSKPRVKADGSGHAYLAGSYFDPLTWGSIPFPEPLWAAGCFLTRLDSLGTFDWGVTPPYTPGSGQFIPGRGNALGTDSLGNAYLLGDVNGTLDWDNGVVTGSGGIGTKSVALLKFDDTGLALWGQQGGSTVIDIMYDVAVAEDGVAHLVGITSAPFTLGPFTADPVNARGTVVARVDPDISTGVASVTVADDELIARPSVFSSVFRLVCATIPNSPSTLVSVVDAMGRVVERAVGLNGELGNGLAPGAYTVLVHDGARVLRTRVVKE